MRRTFQDFLGKEDHIHIAICRYLAVAYPTALVYHSPAEGKRTPFEQYKLKQLGTKAGFPDLLIFFEGRLLGLELKFEVGRPTKAQEAWIYALQQQGHAAAIARGFDEARAVIDKFIKSPTEWNSPNFRRESSTSSGKPTRNQPTSSKS